MNREERRRLQRQAYKRTLRALHCEPECSRCHKRFDRKGQWVSDMEDGWIIDLICEGCTTQVDYSEAVVNDSIHDYMQLDSSRLWAWHKDQRVRVMPMANETIPHTEARPLGQCGLYPRWRSPPSWRGLHNAETLRKGTHNASTP